MKKLIQTNLSDIEEMKKMRILFLANHEMSIIPRYELIECLLAHNYEVLICSPNGDKIQKLKKIGCKHIEIIVNRHGKNPFEDLRLIENFRRIISEVKPSVIFSFTIKPNLYGAIAARMCHIPIIVNVTGLGTAAESKGIMQKLIVFLYKVAFKKVQTVFVQNTENRQFFIDRKIAVDRLKLLPGSGVNLKKFSLIEYPKGETVEFAFIARIMKEKGIDQYLEAAEYLVRRYKNTKFHICGFCEQDYKDKLDYLNEKGVIIYHGLVNDMTDIYNIISCTVLPSFYPEGICNVLLESAACGKPIITTDRAGCREVLEDGVNGFVVKPKDSKDLIDKIEKFLQLSVDERRKMGLAGRKKVEREFDRQIVVEKYMEELHCLECN